MVEYSTRSVTSPSGNCASSTSATRAENWSLSFERRIAFIGCQTQLFHHHRGVGRRRVLAREVIAALHLAKAACCPPEFLVHHRFRTCGLRRGRDEVLRGHLRRKRELHALVVEDIHEPGEAARDAGLRWQHAP